MFWLLKISFCSKKNSRHGGEKRIGKMTSSSTEPRDIRKFGLIALLFFGGFCVLGIWTRKPIPTYLFGCLAALGLAFILSPGNLAPVYLRWIKIAYVVGKAFTALILTLAYFLVITPAALLKRLFGGTPLPTRPDKNQSSYWVPRSEPAQPRERFVKRY
jgi:hypothetical protein